MNIDRPKILVYDSNQLFFRYFKKIFPEYVFVFFSDEESDEFFIGQFDLIIFILDSTVEFIEFFKIYGKGVPIIFGSFDKKIYSRRQEMETVCNLKIIDMSGTKIDVKDQIKMHLQALLVK
jgi:hypothetical protein